MKVVSYSRWSLNTGSIRLIEEGILYQNRGLLTHSHTMTPFDAPGKQAF